MYTQSCKGYHILKNSNITMYKEQEEEKQKRTGSSTNEHYIRR
jgi:hypothetical protein